ncbi:MAG: type II secretion system F family protein [Phycisphaerae bacterium]
MGTFAYKARNSTGEQVNGMLVADSALAAARLLDERRLLPIEVEEVRAQGTSLFTGRARNISQSKVGIIYEQLADLLRAGVPVLRALSVLAKQSGSSGLGRILKEVHDDVAGGDTLADALDKHPQAFRPLQVAMVRAGEKGGFIEDVLSRLSEFISRQDALRNKFIGSMIYPVVLLLAGLGAVVGLMIFVVPNIRELLVSQPNLPAATKIVFFLSDVIGKYYLGLAGAIAAISVGISVFFKTEFGARIWSILQLRTPGIGKIYTMVSLCRFCRIFGTLLNNGIPMIHALKIARDSTGNTILSEAIERATESVNRGEPLAQPLAAAKLFPPAMIDMIAVSEESNTLEKVLIEIANTQEARTANQIDLFVRLLEPLMLMVMGVMVMFIAIGLLVPILQMATGGLK